MGETEDLIERARRNAEEARRVSAETKKLVRTSREIQNWTARVQRGVKGDWSAAFAFDRRSNFLLSLLPAAEFDRLATRFQAVTLVSKQVLHRANSAIDYVYFPVSGLLSATISMRDGDAIEIAAIGNEGMAGLMAVVGKNVSPHDVVVQVPGNGVRIDVATFRAELGRGGMLGDIVTRYQNACTVMNAYQIACNGLHNVGKRCCRRLLLANDRLASNLLPLTHESLALSLGVRRATVSDELGLLQANGIVQTRRGQIEILDRPQLQSLACECYEAVNNELTRVFGLTVVNHSGQATHLAASDKRPM